MSHLNNKIAAIFSEIDHILPEVWEIAVSLYENPEIGGEEEKSSMLLIQSLENHGFTVTRDYFGIKYAFRAVFDSGKPGASIGIFPNMTHFLKSVMAAATT